MKMTSKLSQRCHVFLIIIAIVILVAVIAVVWTFYGSADDSSSTSSTISSKERGNRTEPGGTGDPIFEPDVKNDDRNVSLNVEYIKLWKVSPLPLHDHDLLYDQRHNETIGELVIRHSGHYRHKSAQIWDPHPEYKINVFGQDIHMQLVHSSDNFAHPDLHVTHYLGNVSHKVRHDSKISDCFYNGKVKNDPNSAVAVSLCHGMLGYIHTTNGNFHIEPYEEFFNSSTPILHKVTKITGGNDVNDDCETTVLDQIDDEIHHIPEAYHERRTKRTVYFDYVDDNLSGEYKREIREVFEKKNLNNQGGGSKKVRRKRTGKEYFIELLIVADKTMLEYHKNRDNLVHYILTLMSHVSFLFKEATIGNPISLTVVKIFIDTVTEYKHLSSHQRLSSFCKWQKNNSLVGDHHDAALLLTRTPICGNKEKTSCHTLGIAEVGAMCSDTSSCALAKDNGLSTSYTIAHEVGHLLNMVHDETHHCNLIPGGPHKGIMTKSLTNGSTPWKWSLCSNHYLNEFLDSPRSSCLLRRSSTHHIRPELNNSLPGEYYEVDRQCELGFGPGSTLCHYMQSDICKVLWCTNTVAGCQTQHMPWADGTKCGHESWCHNRECVRKDLSSLTPINGSWGPWKGWGECSRTCGGGIAISKRYCDSPPPQNGGTYCLGENTKYMSCNTQNCPPNSPDFREVQCAEFNGNTIGIQGLTSDVQWIPKYGINYHTDNCKLMCRVKGTSQYYTLKSKVTDGTKCSLNSFGICINGICKPGGCDNKLNSNVQLDECGICFGDNSTCQEVKGNYNYSTYNDDNNGYTKIVRIPRGSFNIYIEQIAFKNNTKNDSYIALADGQTGKYLINQDYTISSFQKDIYYGGIKLTYSGSENITETVTSERHQKLQKDLIVAVLNIYGHPPNVFYKYTIDKEIAPKYGWHLYEGNWTECSSLCNGQQSMVPICVNLDNGYHVDVKFCSNLNSNHLQRERSCNGDCELVWKPAGVGSCTSNCGEGIQEVYYDCFLIEKNHDEVKVVDRSNCKHLNKPHRFEKCQGTCESKRWVYDNWTQCSKSCGGGVRTRNVRCLDVNNNSLSEHLCELKQAKGVLIEACNIEHCPHWEYGEWNQCSVPCGKGIKKRSYYCVKNNQIVAQSFCDLKNLNSIKEICQTEDCTWYAGKWSTCSTSCGEGKETREVSCRSTEGYVKEHFCDPSIKPEVVRKCEVNRCEQYTTFRVDNNEILDDYYGFKWDLGPWTKCSKSCNGGIQSRQVLCRDEKGITRSHMCDLREKPEEHRRCNEFGCPKWVHGEFGGCDANCERHRQVKCENYEGKLVPNSDCDITTKPESTSKCDCSLTDQNKKKNPFLNPKKFIKTHRWKKSSWGPCSTNCGKGTEMRKVSCRDTNRDVMVVDSYCSGTRRPKHIRPCEKYDRFSCNYTWLEGSWSKCSKLCNEGVKHRNVTCHKVFEGAVQEYPVQSSKCDEFTKPKLQEKCMERKCDDKFKWITGNWTKCPDTCGKKFFQTRKLSCINLRGNNVPIKNCPKRFKPARKQRCPKNPCIYTSCKDIKNKLHNSTNADYHITIKGKQALIYCYKMDTNHPEEFITLHPSTRNYAEFFNKRLNRPDSCTRYADPNNCDCSNIETDLVGFTDFWKIRLNLTTMKIIDDDFTFSSSDLNRQKYGRAGDCYSEIEDCIEGSFSVDLTGTSFRISNVVSWYSHGNGARHHIHRRDDRRVYGRCGGNCGSCLPDPTHGLLLEVT